VEPSLVRQIRILQGIVVVLLVTTGFLVVNLFQPLLPVQHFKYIEAQKVNILEKNGILKASLSNAEGFRVFGRAKQDVTFSGLMFYNEEGAEEGGLVYEGKALPGGQRASAGLTFDQYRKDQNIYLHHDEVKDAHGLDISDGLSIMARPDYSQGDKEYRIYDSFAKLPPESREAANLKAAEEGKISTNRVFVGVHRGTKDNVAFDDTGLFIRNRLGQKAIRLYVDADNKPHFEIYDQLGKTTVYELKAPSK
jgi:hypothetical protein